MKKLLLQVIAITAKSIGIIAVFTGLCLTAAQYFFWGAFLFVMGLALLGLQKEGWN